MKDSLSCRQELFRLRNMHVAFSGKMTMDVYSEAALALRWSKGADWAQLVVNFAQGCGELRYTDGIGIRQINFSGVMEELVVQHKPHSAAE